MAKKQTMDHAQLLVLSLLAGEDMYGYQMIVELARRSDHTFEMKEGTLYPVLHGLERDGAVEAYEKDITLSIALPLRDLLTSISRRPPPAGCGNTTALPAGGRRCCGRRLPPGRPTPAR